MNYKANNPSATNFNNRYIFKFGGKIDDYMLNKFVEKYIIDKNMWQVIEFNITDNIT